MEGGLLQSNRCWWWIHEKKKKFRKDLYTYGLNINFTNHWSTWSGRQIRKGSMWFIWCFQMGGYRPSARKTWGSWGEILLPVCANPHLFYLVLNALYIYTITYINIYDRRWLFLFLFPIVVCFSLCYVYQEQLSPWIYQAQLSSIQ